MAITYDCHRGLFWSFVYNTLSKSREGPQMGLEGRRSVLQRHLELHCKQSLAVPCDGGSEGKWIDGGGGT